MATTNIKATITTAVLKGLDFAKAQTDLFHKVFGHPVASEPTMLDRKQVIQRTSFIAEELVEALGVVSEDKVDLAAAVDDLVQAIYNAESKEQEKVGEESNKLVGLADAFTDINYFTQGTFSMMGIEPQPLFDIVQEANMGKLGADGKPIYRESDGKIMKPENWERDFAPEPKLEQEISRQIQKAKETK